MRQAESFAARLLRWYDRHGRKDLPWQRLRTPYRVWVSEVMLQQTQVATVIAYFERFTKRFPSLRRLAEADQDDVLASWSGLGYYSRARNLQRAAQICITRHRGRLPRAFAELAALPGIGRSTAGAILAQAHGLRLPILDGNVKRVLARFHGLRGWPGTARAQEVLWTLAETHLAHSRVADYTQAIMDLGATVCTRASPHCSECPLRGDCVALDQGLTAQLPERKPTRRVPARSTFMLLLQDIHGRILFERRPPTGVWAHLWSLPEAADIVGARARAAHAHAASGSIEFTAMPAFVHTFSHFRLTVTPLAVRVDAPQEIADGDACRWLHRHEAAVLGLPAPVRKLLERLPEEI
jgi:A/G-specific adenine glycosylase